MSNVPAELRYLKSHEWVRIEGNQATVGITDFAQSELGDVVFVQLPEVGRVLQAGEVFGAVESVKTASDLYSPVAGTVVDVNGNLEARSELVNSDPYGEGYMIRVEIAGDADNPDLLDAGAYEALVG